MSFHVAFHVVLCGIQLQKPKTPPFEQNIEKNMLKMFRPFPDALWLLSDLTYCIAK